MDTDNVYALKASTLEVKGSPRLDMKISHRRKILRKKTNSENILGKVLAKYPGKH